MKERKVTNRAEIPEKRQGGLKEVIQLAWTSETESQRGHSTSWVPVKQINDKPTLFTASNPVPNLKKFK
jgi:hypothetical protein